MSKRRVEKEIVVKSANAGFVGEELILVIPDKTSWANHWSYPLEENISPCLMDCGDDQCREFANIQVLNPDLTPSKDWCCHVSECQMKDFRR